MRHPLRAIFLTTAALSAAVVVYLGLTLPPAAVTLDAAWPPTEALGAYHVHTTRSDGSGTVDEIATAAARAGLAFVVFTDHGDATRVPDPPEYRSGVLCLDAVEINTTGGHVVALGLSGPAPYPLAGMPADVIDDIHRLGGEAIVAHPDSPNFALSWRGPGTGFDGIEWLNVDSEWRDKPPTRLLATAVRSLFRPPEAIASLFSPPTRSLARWDAGARARPVFGLAALDAHARIGWRENAEPRGWAVLDRPTYGAMFRTLGNVVILDRPLSGHAVDDAKAVIGAITGGRVFSIVRAFAGPASLEFTADRDGVTVGMGARLAPSDAPATFRARVPEAPGARVTLFRNGRPVTAGRGHVEYTTADLGVYRVEAAWPGDVVPWLLSNPIVIAPAAAPPPAEPTAPDTDTIALPGDPANWHIERAPASSGQVAADASGALQFSFMLAPGPPRGQYAALVTGVGSRSAVDRILFTAHASQPMRLSVQIKLAGVRPDEQRWRRSVYVDETTRPYALPLSGFRPADMAGGAWSPNATRLSSILFVVDTVNTRPGTSGSLAISAVRLGISTPEGKTEN